MTKRATIHDHDHDHDHDRGLQADLQLLAAQASRRGFLRALCVAAAVPMLACNETIGSADSSDSDRDAGTGSGSTTSGGSCEKIPEETAGPYPGDGSNGANALTLSGIVRSDITSSIAGASGTAEGIPLTIKLSLVNSNDGCNPLAGYAVYLWHCDRDGKYSLYSQGVTDQNYLRGVQETDDTGSVTFKTVFPACYAGRMPHVHFEVYPGLAAATASGNKIATSQLAFPLADCNTVYASEGYEQSVKNLSQISFATDNVFSDGTELQMATVTGSVSAGYSASLQVAIAD
jgi:protocatechuate 3,4-dioxygenase beta subunit